MGSCVSGFLELTLPVIGSLHQIASTLTHLQCAQIQLREVGQGEQTQLISHSFPFSVRKFAQWTKLYVKIFTLKQGPVMILVITGR